MKLFWFYFSRTVVALTTVSSVYALIIPSFFIWMLAFPNAPILVALAPLALAVSILVLGLAVSHWTTEPFKFAIGIIRAFFSPRRNPVSKPVLIASGFTAVAFLFTGFATGKIGETVGTLVVLVINSLLAMVVLWLLSGKWLNAGEHEDTAPRHLEELLDDLTLACKDFFAPTADYTVKREVPTKNGGTRMETYVDESARTAATRAAIQEIKEVAPRKYRIKFRNTTGKSDKKFIDFFDGVASVLELHDYDLRDDDTRKGHIQINVLAQTPDNEISNPHGMLIWK